MAVETTETTEHVPREELGEIWRQYKASGDRALRDRLILTYAPLVKYVAGQARLVAAAARRGGRPRSRTGCSA